MKWIPKTHLVVCYQYHNAMHVPLMIVHWPESRLFLSSYTQETATGDTRVTLDELVIWIYKHHMVHFANVRWLGLYDVRRQDWCCHPECIYALFCQDMAHPYIKTVFATSHIAFRRFTLNYFGKIWHVLFASSFISF